MTDTPAMLALLPFFFPFFFFSRGSRGYPRLPLFSRENRAFSFILRDKDFPVRLPPPFHRTRRGPFSPSLQREEDHSFSPHRSEVPFP